MTIEQDVVALDELTHAAVGRVFQAVRNLLELSPGFPASTPGNGSPGAGQGGGTRTVEILSSDESYTIDRVPITSVEAGILHGHPITEDLAVVHLGRIRQLARELYAPTRELHDLVQRWAYRTAGEWSDAPERHAQPTESAANSQGWCISCTRLHKCEPVRSDASGLCRWCGDYRAANGDLPPLAILDAHHTGRRITTAMVALAKRQARKPDKLKAKKRKKRTGAQV